jgi:hypothetical protein
MTVNDNLPDPYVAAGPLDQPPGGFRPDERRAAMAHVLRGVQLGAYDERMIAWTVQCDDSTARTIASLIERARDAACAEHVCLDEAQLDTVLDALERRATEDTSAPPASAPTVRLRRTACVTTIRATSSWPAGMTPSRASSGRRPAGDERTRKGAGPQ